MRIVQVFVQAIVRVVPESRLLIRFDLVRSEEIFINLLLVLEACTANLLPDTLLNDLATESIIDGRVEKREPDAPLAFGRFGGILLVPNTIGSLVCKIHLCIKMAIAIAARLEGDSLREVVINSR